MVNVYSKIFFKAKMTVGDPIVNDTMVSAATLFNVINENKFAFLL